MLFGKVTLFSETTDDVKYTTAEHYVRVLGYVSHQNKIHAIVHLPATAPFGVPVDEVTITYDIPKKAVDLLLGKTRKPKKKKLKSRGADEQAPSSQTD